MKFAMTSILKKGKITRINESETIFKNETLIRAIFLNKTRNYNNSFYSTNLTPVALGPFSVVSISNSTL